MVSLIVLMLLACGLTMLRYIARRYNFPE